VSANGYTLCLYDASAAPQPRLRVRAPAGSNWKPSSAGFNYRSKAKTPDGILTAKLKAGPAGGTKILVKGKGDDLELPALTGLTLPVTVQLRRAGGGCWGATFSTPLLSGAELFKSKSD
jgi:hypothetical protein